MEEEEEEEEDEAGMEEWVHFLNSRDLATRAVILAPDRSAPFRAAMAAAAAVASAYAQKP